MIDDNFNVTLIDLSYTKKFMTSNGAHTKYQAVDIFEGNIMYSSIFAMNYRNTSRRDDLISVAYILYILLNKNMFPTLEYA